MKKIMIILLFLITNFAIAETTQQFAKIGDFQLESGEIIKNCKIGYQIIGKVNVDSSNIVIFPTWFAGLSEHIIGAIEKHNLINKKKYLIIAIDALGNGISSSPSNYMGKMPIFSIKDMVDSQYLMLTKILKIKHLHAVVGGSMGSFQTFQWVTSYPKFMNKAVPYVCSPVRTSSDKMWLNLQKDIITLHKKNQIEEGETQRILNIFTSFFAKTQNNMTQNIKSSKFEEYYKTFVVKISEPFTLDNRLSQINAMIQHDITKDYNYSMEKTAQIIKAEMLIIISDSDQIVNPKPATQFAKLTNSQLIILSNECGHLAPGCDIATFAGYINEFLDN